MPRVRGVDGRFTRTEEPQEPETPGAEPETPPDPEPEAPASETPPEPEAPASETQPEPETPPEPAAPDWITDDFRDLASSYGLSEDDLAGFDSARDFQQACRMADRQFAASMKAEEQVTKPAQVEPSPPRPRPKKLTLEPQPPAPEPVDDDDLTLDLAQYEGYDDETKRVVKVAKHLLDQNKVLKTQTQAFHETLQRIEKKQSDQEYHAELARFDDAVDKMDADRFGGTADLDDDTIKRRESLWDAYQIIKEIRLRTSARSGRVPKLPSMEAMLHGAELMAFGDEILARDRRANARAIAEQSKRVRPSPGKTKVLPGAEEKDKAKGLRAEIKRVQTDPEITAFFDSVREASGNAPQ